MSKPRHVCWRAYSFEIHIYDFKTCMPYTNYYEFAAFDNPYDTGISHLQVQKNL
jgi:hypothetical protein